MKRFLALFLVLTLALTALMACGKEKELSAEELEKYPIQSIAIKTKPTKLSYFEGEPIKGDGMVLTLNREGGRKQDMAYDPTLIFDVVSFTPSKVEAGTQVVTVNYGGFSTTFNIEVVQNNVTHTVSGDTLTISGTGRMADYGQNGAEWVQHRDVIKNIVIGEGVTSIGDYAFANLDFVENVTIASSVTSIGSHAFELVFYTQTIYIPAAVTTIADTAFVYFNASTFVVDTNNASFSAVDGVLFNKDQTKLVAFPLGKEAESYTIPGTVKEIGGYAFYSGELISITLPASVKTIGDYAFAHCGEVTDFRYSGETSAWGKITKGYRWNGSTHFTAVHCTNGDITDLSQEA